MAGTSSFNEDDFEQALQPSNWLETKQLNTPTFIATITPDGSFFLRGPALVEGFSKEAVQALTRFLSENVQLPPKEPPYDFSDFHPQRIDE